MIFLLFVTFSIPNNLQNLLIFSIPWNLFDFIDFLDSIHLQNFDVIDFLDSKEFVDFLDFLDSHEFTMTRAT